MADVSPRPDVPAAMRRLPDALPRRLPEPLPLGTGLESPAVMAVGASSWAGSVAGSGEVCLDRVEATRTLGQKADPDSPPARIQPLGCARYKVQFTASAELDDKLERLQALMRSQVPDGDLGAVIERAVTETLDRLEARRFARTNRPGDGAGKACGSPSFRHIPAAVRRAVYARDGGRCHYRDALGRRCSERHRLEYHHRHPFAVGGDHSLKNISLLCPLCRARHKRHYSESRIMPSGFLEAARGVVSSRKHAA